MTADLVPLGGGDASTAFLAAAGSLAPLDRLPGTSADDPFQRLATAWLLGYGGHTQTAYRRDLTAWATWCDQHGVHPLAAQRFHVDAWVRHLTTQPQPRTGRPTSAATIARRLSALSRFYDYGIHDAHVLTHSPVASVRRPRVSDDSQAIGLTAEELRRLLAAAAAHSARTHALVALLTFCGLRIGEALSADVRDYGHDHGHRVLKITRKGGKAARVPLPPPVVRALDDYLAEPGVVPTGEVSAERTMGGPLGHLEPRTSGPLFLATSGDHRYPYTSAYEQLGRLCRTAGLPRGVSPHSLRHSYATESLRLGAALQDVQDAMGHADPRTTRRYDRSRHNLDRSPNYLLASSLTSDGTSSGGEC